MKKIFLSSMFVVAAVAMVSCGSKQAAKQSVEQEVVTLPKVEAQTVASRMVSQEATFTGTVEAQVVNNIAPQQPLRIKEIRFDVGDHVKKGDLLVKLDNSSLVQAKAQLDNAKKEYERTNELYEFGGASKSEWDARRLQYEVAQTAYNNLVENTTLISPISGIVTARNYDKGDMYAGQPVLVIEQIKPVKIMINVSEPFFGKLKKGMQVYVTLDAYGDEEWTKRLDKALPLYAASDVQNLVLLCGVIVGVTIRNKFVKVGKRTCVYSASEDDGVGRREVSEYVTLTFVMDK